MSFYHKATDTSNLFYDNTYKFTKDVSIVLGRIEAGFGEKFKHIDEGYKEISGRIYNSGGKEEKIAELEEALQKSETEKEQQIIDFANRSKLAEKDKEEFIDEIKERDNELKRKVHELNILKSQLMKSRSNSEINLRYKLQDYLHFIYDRFGKSIPVNSLEESRDLFESLRKFMDDQFLEDMKKLGLVDPAGFLTLSGVKFIKIYIGSCRLSFFNRNLSLTKPLTNDSYDKGYYLNHIRMRNN